jgi:hypothetical protein
MKKEIMIFTWIARIILLAVMWKLGHELYGLYEGYDGDVFMAESAVQATQLSNEYLLKAFKYLPGMIAAAVLYLGIEINYAATKIAHSRQQESITIEIEKTKAENTSELNY